MSQLHVPKVLSNLKSLVIAVGTVLGEILLMVFISLFAMIFIGFVMSQHDQQDGSFNYYDRGQGSDVSASKSINSNETA